MMEMEDDPFILKSKQYTDIVKKLPVRFDTVTTLCTVAKAGRKIIKVKHLSLDFPHCKFIRIGISKEYHISTNIVHWWDTPLSS